MSTLSNQSVSVNGLVPFNPLVSVCDHLYDVGNLGQKSLSDIFDAIQSGFCAEQISIIRAVLDGTVSSPESQVKLPHQLGQVLAITPKKDRASFLATRSKYNLDPSFPPTRIELAGWLKTALPGVLFSGIFLTRSRAGFQSHSGIICIDFDDVEDAAIKCNEIGDDPYCLAAFVSPSGTGIKAIIRVPPTDEKGHTQRTFPAVASYLSKKYGVVVDESGSDVPRLCFLSWHPEMKTNFSALEFPVPALGATVPHSGVAPTNPAGITQTPGEDYNARGPVAALLRKHGWSSSDDMEWTRPGKESGRSATLGEVAGPPRSLWVFSDNAAPFLPNKRYEPWQVFSVLECDGNDRVAFNKLRSLGYGALDGLPSTEEILILPSAMGLTISASAKDIFTLIAPRRTLFSRGGIVHEVSSGVKGAQLEVLPPEAFRSRLEKFGRPMAWRPDGTSGVKLRKALCSVDLAKSLLASTEANSLLPPIRSVIASPCLALNGAKLITLGLGWNPQNGGVFVSGGVAPEELPLAEGVDALCELLADFDFQSPGDCSRALAALITPALKAGGLLTGNTPIEVCEADKSQSGKGFFLKLLAALYAETPSLIAQKDGGVGSLDESIASALLAGRPFVQLDNMRGKVASTQLEAILTANGLFSCRIPHRQSVDVDTRPFTFSMTSNGVETTRDLANRCSFIRIVKRSDGYQFKDYPEGGLHEHITANQPYYLGCVFSIVRAWVEQGRKRTSEYRHDFREWAQTLDWIVTMLFEAPPLLDGNTEARDRVSDPSRSWLRALTLQVVEQDRLGETMQAAELVEISEEADIAIPHSRDEVEAADKARAIGKVMKKIFTTGPSVSVDSWQVTRTQVYSQTLSKNAWHYSFTPKPSDAANAANAHNF